MSATRDLLIDDCALASSPFTLATPATALRHLSATTPPSLQRLNLAQHHGTLQSAADLQWGEVYRRLNEHRLKQIHACWHHAVFPHAMHV
jgi:hypothetical protein